MNQNGCAAVHAFELGVGGIMRQNRGSQWTRLQWTFRRTKEPNQGVTTPRSDVKIAAPSRCTASAACGRPPAILSRLGRRARRRHDTPSTPQRVGGAALPHPPLLSTAGSARMNRLPQNSRRIPRCAVGAAFTTAAPRAVQHPAARPAAPAPSR